jgi:hypothetical protein
VEISLFIAIMLGVLVLMGASAALVGYGWWMGTRGKHIDRQLSQDASERDVEIKQKRLTQQLIAKQTGSMPVV